MRISKKHFNQNLRKQIYHLLYQVVADIHNPKEAEEFLKDFLSKTELEAISKRLAIIYYLNKGRSYQNIKSNLAVSSATIGTMAEQMKKKPGLQIALKKIKADEWADKWAEKIGRLIKKG